MRTPQTQPKELPSLAEVAPRHAELTLKALYLERQREELLIEAEELPSISDKLQTARPQPVQPPKHKTRSPAAKAALGDLEIPDAPAPDYAAPDPARESTFVFGDPMVKKAADLAVQINGLDEAIAVIHAELPRALAEGSRVYCDRIREDYSAYAAHVCKTLIEFATAVTRHQDYLARVKAAGVTTAFLAPLNLENTDLGRIMGAVRSGQSDVHDVLSRAADGGHFSEAAAALAEMRKAAPPLPPAPFAEAVADLQAAQKAREDARKGRAMVYRRVGSSLRMIRRSVAEKLDTPQPTAAEGEPATRESLTARVRARIARAGERWADDGDAA